MSTVVELQRDIQDLMAEVEEAIMNLHNAEAADEFVMSAQPEEVLDYAEHLHIAAGNLEDAAAQVAEKSMKIIALAEDSIPE